MSVATSVWMALRLIVLMVKNQPPPTERQKKADF